VGRGSLKLVLGMELTMLDASSAQTLLEGVTRVWVHYGSVKNKLSRAETPDRVLYTTTVRGYNLLEIFAIHSEVGV